MSGSGLSILSFNFLGMPFFSKNYRLRLEKLTEEMVKVDPDIICFQEVWLASTRKYLQENFKLLGFKYYFHPISGLRLNGFFVLSKLKMSAMDHWSSGINIRGFGNSLTEILGTKGFCLFKVTFGRKEVFIFNVHASVDWSNKFNEGSRYFKQQLKEFTILAKRINSLKGKKIIVVGDFNIEEGSLLYKRFMEMSGVDHFLKGLILRTILPNIFSFLVRRVNKPRGVKRDFVFAKNFSKDSILSHKVLWDKPFEKIGYISDHVAILVKIKL